MGASALGGTAAWRPRRQSDGGGRAERGGKEDGKKYRAPWREGRPGRQWFVQLTLCGGKMQELTHGNPKELGRAPSPKSLCEEHLRNLRNSGLTDETIARAGIRSLSPEELEATVKRWGLKSVQRNLKYLKSGYIIPYPGKQFARIRFFWHDGTPKGVPRYGQPAGSDVHAYVPLGVEECLGKEDVTLWVVEGEKKALLLWQLGVPVIALGGVWNTRNNGELLPELKKHAKAGGAFCVAFDADLHTNKDIQLALYDLSFRLTAEGGCVRIATWAPECGKGIDDAIVGGRTTLEEIAAGALELEEFVRVYGDKHWDAIAGRLGAVALPRELQEAIMRALAESRGVQAEAVWAEIHGKRTAADRLLHYAIAAKATFVLDQYGQPYVMVGGTFYSLPRGAYSWLRKLALENERRIPKNEALQAAAGALQALAEMGGRRVVLYVRSAWEPQLRSLFVWLGPGRILEINDTGWRVLENAPVHFRVFPTTCELPTPSPDKQEQLRALEEVWRFVAPEDEAGARLVLAWLATAWLEHIARPILLYLGSGGAGKSVRQKGIKLLLDPTKPDSIRVDSYDLTQKLAHCQVALFDNVTSIPEWALDAICRAVTGEGDSKRKLYTDDEDVVYEYKRAILLNTINFPAARPDFVDRLLPVEFRRIPDEEREEEDVVLARFAELQPGFLGAIATILSDAIAAHARTHLRRKPRFAAWGRWAAAVYEAMGWGAEQFEADWALVVERQHSAAISESSVAQALLRWLGKGQTWQGTPSELLRTLEPYADELKLLHARDWPKSAVWLVRRLNELRPVLEGMGVFMQQRHNRDGFRLIVLERRG